MPEQPLLRATATYLTAGRASFTDLIGVTDGIASVRLVLTTTELRWKRHPFSLTMFSRAARSVLVGLCDVQSCRAGALAGPLARIAPRAVAGQHLEVSTVHGETHRFVVARADRWATAIGDAKAALTVDRRSVDPLA